MVRELASGFKLHPDAETVPLAGGPSRGLLWSAVIKGKVRQQLRGCHT